MKWKQVLVVGSILGASGNLLAQDGKAPPVIKSVEKQPLNKQLRSTDKKVIHQSFNPDQPAIMGVPAVVVDQNRPKGRM